VVPAAGKSPRVENKGKGTGRGARSKDAADEAFAAGGKKEGENDANQGEGVRREWAPRKGLW